MTRLPPLALLLGAFGSWSVAYTIATQWLPVVAGFRGITPAATGALLAAGYAGAAVIGTMAGVAADRWGARRTLLIMWAAGCPAAVLLALADRWAVMLPATVLVMASVAAVPVLGALTTQYTPVSQERRGYAWLFAGGPIGMLLANAVGGWAAQHWNPAAPLWLMAGAQIAATLLVALLPPAGEPGSPAGVPSGVRGLPVRVVLWLLPLGILGYTLLALPNNFTLLFASDVLRLRLDRDGWLHMLLALSQLGWHLLLSRWPRPGKRLGLGLDRGTATALTLILLASGVGALLPALFPTGLAMAASLLLRGSFFCLQVVGSNLLSRGALRGRSTPFAAAGLAVGFSTAVASLMGGGLYHRQPALPFLVAGAAGVAGALFLTVLPLLRPTPEE